MSDAACQTQAGLEAQPPMPVRRVHNFIYCPRLFDFQLAENNFQESGKCGWHTADGKWQTVD